MVTREFAGHDDAPQIGREIDTEPTRNPASGKFECLRKISGWTLHITNTSSHRTPEDACLELFRFLELNFGIGHR
jgi:hypothetical protein